MTAARTVEGVSEFLVEVYVSPANLSLRLPCPEDLVKAAEQLSREGRPVRLLRSLFVPEEETCFYLFEATTSDAVREAARRAGLACDHVVEAAASWSSGQRDADTAGDNTGRPKTPAPRRGSGNARPGGAEGSSRAVEKRPTGTSDTTTNKPIQGDTP
jgi:hypothetical protein